MGASDGYGIVWGLADNSNFFEFVISNCGHYRIAKHENGAFKEFVDWKPCSAMRLGNDVNILEIHRDGDLVAFLINSELVTKLSAEMVMQVSDRKFGFIVYNKSKIKVHSLTISTQNTAVKALDLNRAETATKASFYAHEPPEDDTLEDVLADLKALVGLARPKQQLLSFANLLKVQTERRTRGLKTADTSLHLVLYGPPGTGKTTIARLVGRLYKQLGFLLRGHVLETDRAGIVGGFLGQTALRLDDAVEQALDGVLFIDEAYALVPKDGWSYDYGHEAVQVLLKRMEDHRARLAVIVAGYPDEMEHFITSNPGLQSRFNRLIYLDHYKPSELILIFAKFCHDYGYTLDLPARVILQTMFETAYAKRSKSFGNGRLVRTLFERSVEQQANRIADGVSQMDDSAISLITAEDLELAEI